MVNPQTVTGLYSILISPAESGTSTIRRYLIAYNIVSFLGWSYVVFAVLAHLSGLTEQPQVASPAAPPTATPGLKRILGSIPYLKTNAPVRIQVQSQIPQFLISVFDRAKTTYTAVGWQIRFVQSLAILEVIHSLIGWVRSPLPTTTIQVGSRLLLVWGTERFDSVSITSLSTIASCLCCCLGKR